MYFDIYGKLKLIKNTTRVETQIFLTFNGKLGITWGIGKALQMDYSISTRVKQTMIAKIVGNWV